MPVSAVMRARGRVPESCIIAALQLVRINAARLATARPAKALFVGDVGCIVHADTVAASRSHESMRIDIEHVVSFLVSYFSFSY